MALTLVHRAGVDTLAKLSAAAPRRFREAQALLAQGESLGAIYLFGYSIEIRLKAAYYRTIGLVPGTIIDARLHRKPAERAIDALPLLPRHTAPPGPSAGHHIIGWAQLLEQERSSPGRVPLNAAILVPMRRHAANVFDCWVEFLRYRANKPYNRELLAVVDAANWFRENTNRLWR